MRLCPRTAEDMGGATFGQYQDDLVLPMSKACVAPTGRYRCVGPSCVGGCEVEQSAESCTACCGGEVEPAMARCLFPFLDYKGAKHYTCIEGTDRNGTTGHYCPTAVDADLKMTKGSWCMSACKQVNYVSAPAEICGEMQCAAAGSAPRAATVEIGTDGFDGDSGFYFGARYRLVLFAAADALHASVALRTTSGKQLWRGTFNRSACRAPERRRLHAAAAAGEEDEDEAAAAAAAAAAVEQDGEGKVEGEGAGLEGSLLRGLARRARRRLLVRRDNWWVQMTVRNMTGFRRREGPEARWNGASVRTLAAAEGSGGLVRCAEEVVPAGTLVALQGGCDQPSGLTRLARQMLRAELGESFVLQRQDFPLYLTLLDADASDRGEQTSPPELYFSLYTEELNVARRLGLWLGVPLAFLLLSCCCCCCCCCLCGKSKRPADKAEGDDHQLADDSRLLDISAISGDDTSAQPPESAAPLPLSTPLEIPPTDPFGTPLGQSPPPQRASSRCSSSGTRALRRARSATNHSRTKQRSADGGAHPAQPAGSERYVTRAHEEDYPSDNSPSPALPLGAYRINEAGQAVRDPPYLL